MPSQNLRRGLLALLSTATLLLHGCGPAPVGMPDSDPGVDPQTLPTAAPSATSEATTVPTITPEPTVEVATLPEERPERAALPAVVGDYLAAGGDLEMLEERLRDWGAFGEEMGGFWGDLDLNGDDYGDLAIVARDAGEEGALALIPTGILLAYLGGESGYSETLLVDAGGFPEIQAITDLTGDGQDDLLFAATDCGAHTCFGDLQGYRWAGADAVPLFTEPVDYPYPGYTVEDMDGDGLREVIVETGAIGSVGAGPQRTYRLVYAWDGSHLALAEQTLTSPEHPIHLINDADALLEGGEYAEAVTLYERSYTDPDLDDISSWAEEGWEVTLQAYARYRQVLAWSLAGDRDAAGDAYDLLLAELGDDPRAERFVDLAEVFWEAHDGGADLQSACAAVRERAGEMDWGVDVALNAFGYANRTYGPEDMCPLAPAD